MSAKIYLHLLFFCVILCQEMFAKLSDKDTSLSSDFLVRKRRVINHLPEGCLSPRIESVNYIVRVKEINSIICAGAILSHYTVITAAPCVFLHDVSMYKIYSGSIATTGAAIHNVTSKELYSGKPPHRHFEGIALITVDPPFIYSSKIGHIELYAGPLPAGALVTVFGWGNTYPMQPGPESRKRLRKITLPVMNLTECRHIYAGRFDITEKYICTYHQEQYCARDDAGAPLVFNNMLAGIHVSKGEFSNQRNPDVFINLIRHEYSEWIKDHSLLL